MVSPTPRGRICADDSNCCCLVDWRHDSQTPSLWEAEILKLFADDPLAPFSVHKFAEYGTQKCGMYVGEWFGPSTTARCIGYVDTAISPWLSQSLTMHAEP